MQTCQTRSICQPGPPAYIQGPASISTTTLDTRPVFEARLVYKARLLFEEIRYLICLSLIECIGVLDLVEIEGKKHYDLVVIGGGSGGLACSKEGEYAADLNSCSCHGACMLFNVISVAHPLLTTSGDKHRRCDHTTYVSKEFNN